MTKQPPGKYTSGKAGLNGILLVRRPALLDTFFSVKFVEVILVAGVYPTVLTLFLRGREIWG